MPGERQESAAVVSAESIELRTDSAQVRAAHIAVPEEGSGPGLLLLHESPVARQRLAELFAEEGYLVLAPDLSALAMPQMLACAAALRERPQHDGPTGVLGFGTGGTLALLAAREPIFSACVAYYPAGLEERTAALDEVRCPATIHFAGAAGAFSDRYTGNPGVRTFVYHATEPGFYERDRSQYNRPAARISHTRTLERLRESLGPRYDLAALWDRHLMHEFMTRSAEETIATMVDEPYVNHVPTLTGGVGRGELQHFYRDYFVDVNDPRMQMIPVSRTVGVDRVVDEMVACFRHDRLIDYLLPGVAATGREVKLPMVAIASFRGKRLYHEHLYWDHATLLVQVGLLDPKILPVSGAEQAEKVLDESSRPSNAMMSTWRPPM